MFLDEFGSGGDGSKGQALSRISLSARVFVWLEIFLNFHLFVSVLNPIKHPLNPELPT